MRSIIIAILAIGCLGAAEFPVEGVHMCCGGCEKKITALVTGAGAAGCEIADGTVTATGPVSPKAVVEALNGGGLAATPTP